MEPLIKSRFFHFSENIVLNTYNLFIIGTLHNSAKAR